MTFLSFKVTDIAYLGSCSGTYLNTYTSVFYKCSNLSLTLFQTLKVVYFNSNLSYANLIVKTLLVTLRIL